MDEKKICPISGCQCKEDCGWYSETYEECAIKSIGDSVTKLSSLAYDDGGMCIRMCEDD